MTDYEDKLKTAYHEIGHCLAALLSKGTYKIHKVTILPRGDSLGLVKKFNIIYSLKRYYWIY